MKLSLPAALLLGSSLVNALPTAENLHQLRSGTADPKAVKRCPFADIPDSVNEHGVDKRLLLSSLNTPVDVSGGHAFQPPNFAAGDQRGPCPGLNALANHNYIPHNGVVTMLEAISAMNEVYGMGLDLAGILAAMGTVWTGNPLSLSPSFSIGGISPQVNNLLDNLLGLMGTPRGIIGSHNFIEADASNTRDDLYVTGNNYKLNMNKFLDWYEMSTDGTFDMNLMADRAMAVFQQSKATNPDFYYGPFTGAIARNAGFLFAGHVLANHSAEHPEGLLTKEVAKSFFAIYGEDDNNLEYREGWEQIPANWYKTPVDYGLVNLNADLLQMLARHPDLADIGGNTGSVNSFTGINIGDMTGGVYNAKNLLQGNNLLCFAMEVVKTLSPNSLTGLYSTLSGPLSILTNAIATPLLDLACPAFADVTLNGQPYWQALQNVYPGALKSGGAL